MIPTRIFVGLIVQFKVMDIVLIILAVLCILVGIAGSVLPVLPGPPVAYLGLWLAQWTRFCDFSTSSMVWMGIVMVVVSVLDNVLPPYITQKTGGSRYATIGTIVGMLVGMFFSMVGLIMGMLIGAFVGELLFARKGAGNALKATFGAFVGFVLGTGIKIFYCLFLLIKIFI